MLLALKIEVDSLAAARFAVPRLVELLQSVEATASFFINIGPDRSGSATGPRFQIGESRRQIRRNKGVSSRHGAARFYGRLLRAPDIAKHASDTLLQLKQRGFETGLRGWDRVNWIKQIDTASQTWIATELEAALYAYENLFGEPAKSIALPGWRTSRAAIRLEQQLGFQYGSDCRGVSPFLPVVEGEPVRVVQLPTTLPTLAELVGEIQGDEIAAVANLLDKTEQARASGHVFTINADMDGGQRLPLLQQLFAGWREQGYQLCALKQLYSTLDLAKLPWHTLEQQTWPGYSGNITVQGAPFPA